MTEDDLSAKVKIYLDDLKRVGKFKGVYFHVANEVRLTRNPHRNKNILLKRERIGVRSGAGDWVIAWNGGYGFIELKKMQGYMTSPKTGKWIQDPSNAGGKLSEAQEAFRDECELYGINYAVCRSIDDIEVTLEDWSAI